jgi:hypothetical protein
MRPAMNSARGKAAAVAVLLLLAGGAAGVIVDRVWLLPRAAGTFPLTAHAMAARLELGPVEEARIRTLLDSIHTDVTAAADHGPDSLRHTAQNAHLRIEAALPPEARPAFRSWMHDHHRQLMERLDGVRGHGPAHGEAGGRRH